ncbi:hypothetical protein [Tepidibacter formicigenes]|jgi:hypothetical protein|uniref:Uncharacterized protein n=1 Tax=Tepidibacter formicigenes DSM 15518 TaxID=1123349 RepID=A0A1M6QJ69_9FIRM|nr:hypothetical protein [Tepidibacter formicigenes]SHK20113.1 hypothetical protein SAMN02744037_01860 [Tepidibacter formicigenes DSM 15518]
MSITDNQIKELKRLRKELNIFINPLPKTYEEADKLIKEIYANWGK